MNAGEKADDAQTSSVDIEAQEMTDEQDKGKRKDSQKKAETSSSVKHHDEHNPKINSSWWEHPMMKQKRVPATKEEEKPTTMTTTPTPPSHTTERPRRFCGAAGLQVIMDAGWCDPDNCEGVTREFACDYAIAF